MTFRYSVDRIEEGTAVLIPDGNEKTLYLNSEEYKLYENDIVDITFNDGEIVSLQKDDTARDERLSTAKSKLKALFAKSKK